MKKLILILSLFLILSPLWAEPASSSSSIELSAFKNGTSSNVANTTVTITAYNSQTVTGRGNEFVILDESVNSFSNYQLADAFAITISTSSKNPVNVGIKFTPFINLSNNQKTVPAIYTYNPVTPTQTQATSDSYTTYMLVSSNTRRQSRNFQYTPSIELKSGNTIIASGTSISVSEETSLTLTQSIANITFKYKQSNYNSSYPNTYNGTSIPNEYSGGTNSSSQISSATLPPNGHSPTVTTTVRFTLSVDSSYFNISNEDKFFANQYYASTVTLTISGT